MTQEEEIEFAALQRKVSDLERLASDLRAALEKSNQPQAEDGGVEFSYTDPGHLMSESEVYEYVERRIAEEAARFNITGGGDVQVSGSGFNWAIKIKESEVKSNA